MTIACFEAILLYFWAYKRSFRVACKVDGRFTSYALCVYFVVADQCLLL